MRISVRCPGLGVVGLVPFLASPQQYAKAIPSLLVGIVVTCLILLVVYETRTGRYEETTDSGRRYPVAIATDITDPNLHYGVVVDCGSSGSRVYVYFWPPHTGNNKELLTINPLRDSQGNLVIKKITPGLSDLADTPSHASEYLRPLLEYAEQHIPVEKHRETPLYVMATAGLRMLSESKQKALITDMQRDIPQQSNFLFQDTHAEVISGKQEGVYTWIAINYVLGKFNHMVEDDAPLSVVEMKGSEHRTHVRKRTVGIIDMGGGSAQIAFELSKTVKFEPQEESAKSLLAEFNLGCSDYDVEHNYRVYVATFLGYGGNAARKRYENMLVAKVNSSYTQSSNVSRGWVGSLTAPVIPDPCLPLDMPQTVTYGGRQVSLRGTGDYQECMDHLQPLINSSRPCMKEPCSMNGVYQPEIDTSSSEFYGFSEFYYSMEDVLRMGGPYNYKRFQTAAEEYCGTHWAKLQSWFAQNLYPKADEHRFKFQCFKSAWMSTVLHEGFKFPHHYQDLTTAKLIQGSEVHWTLGALLYKTRYFPLSEIQQHRSVHHSRQNSFFSPLHDVSYVVFVCLGIVVAAILIYLRRLRIVKRSDLRKIPSMAYFMTEDGQAQDGVTIRQYYP